MYDDSIFDKSQKEFQDKLDLEVLAHLPKSIRKFSTNYYGNSSSEPITSMQGILPSENKSFIESEYYDSPNSFFIHFTSEKSAYSIIESGNIRMYNLNNSNDDNELSGPSRKFNYGQKQVNILKSQIFTLSLTTINNQLDDDNLKHHWEIYGDNKKGVAIIFQVLNDPIDWRNYHFAKIKYKPAKWIAPFAGAVHKWNETNPFYYAHIPKLLSFHKTKKWEVENEYRLLYNSSFNFNNNKPNPSNSVKGSVQVGENWEEREVPIIRHSPKKDKEEIYFLELPLYKVGFSNIEDTYFQYSPLLKVVGFIIGSKNNAAEECCSKLSKLVKTHLCHDDIDLYRSKLKV
jgi:hypothetical protein